MTNKTITVEKFVPYEEAENLPQAPIGGLGGFFKDGNRWGDYIGAFIHSDQPEVPASVYFEALREKIITDNIRNGGFWHQAEGCPIFSDGKTATFSFRAWGDLMAAIWSEQDQKDYSYINFAWEN